MNRKLFITNAQRMTTVIASEHGDIPVTLSPTLTADGQCGWKGQGHGYVTIGGVAFPVSFTIRGVIPKSHKWEA